MNKEKKELVDKTLSELWELASRRSWLADIEKRYASFVGIIGKKKEIPNFSVEQITIRHGSEILPLEINCHFGIDPTHVEVAINEALERVRNEISLMDVEIEKMLKIQEPATPRDYNPRA